MKFPNLQLIPTWQYWTGRRGTLPQRDNMDASVALESWQFLTPFNAPTTQDNGAVAVALLSFTVDSKITQVLPPEQVAPNVQLESMLVASPINNSAQDNARAFAQLESFVQFSPLTQNETDNMATDVALQSSTI